MDRPKYHIWLLSIALIALAGCTLNRAEETDISSYDPANQPLAAAITPTPSPTMAAQEPVAPAAVSSATAIPPTNTPLPTVPPAPPTEPAAPPPAEATLQPQDNTGTQLVPPSPTPLPPPPTSITQPLPTQSLPEATATMVIQVKPAVPPTATPAPPPNILQPAYIPPDATFGFCYRAQPGETIEVLAQKYGTSVWAINRANDLHEPFFVKAQQTIFVPILPGNGPNVYPVELGDTLAVIAERCKIPERMLARVNNLQVGDPIYLPAGSVVPLADGTTHILAQDTAVVRYLIIPIPPFPPPSRYQYPSGPIPIVPFSTPYPIAK